MIITICIGSNCHLKGSKEIVEKLEELVKVHKMEEEIKLRGSFCMGECMKGVSVKVDETFYSLSPSNIEQFFLDEVLGRF